MAPTCCTEGYIHTSDDLEGTEEKVHGLDTYVVRVEQSRSIVVIIPDIFGWNLPNTRGVADTVSREMNATVYLPDFMFGDMVPHNYLYFTNDPDDMGFTDKVKKNYERATVLGTWILRHREGVSWPIVTGFFEALYKEDRSRNIFTMGYCWGGRYVCLLTHRDRWTMSDGSYKEGGFITAAYSGHPSLLSIPKEILAISRPVSFALGERDDALSVKETEKLKKALDSNSEAVVYNGAKHGFAIRGNISIEKEKKDWEDAIKQAVDWFKKHGVGNKSNL